uniref:Uncharacterized protein n=1 Tax=Moniliophthora roreri TaxID=221103 RepID=A0A0W0G900_MONRR
MKPHWYFTNDSINDYMHFAIKGGWDRNRVVGKIEVFAVAGCNAAKKAIGDNSLRWIFYGNFDAAVTLKYRVVLEGWPLGQIENLSKISSSVPPLKKALSMIQNGECGFHCMTDDEYAKWKLAYLANLPNIQSGPPKTSDDSIEHHANSRHIQNDKNVTQGPKGGKLKSATTCKGASRAQCSVSTTNNTGNPMPPPSHPPPEPPACTPIPSSELPAHTPTPPSEPSAAQPHD